MLIISITFLSDLIAAQNRKGTPKPIESTLPTLVIIPATAIWGYKKRKQSYIKLQL
jgi:hypothetical protein